jgi:hypothetical protein
MYVGVDAGTSMVKAAAFDTAGRRLDVESRPVGLHLRGGAVDETDGGGRAGSGAGRVPREGLRAAPGPAGRSAGRSRQ